MGHHHDHSHGHHDHAHGISRQGNRSGLLIAFLITVAIMVLEFAGGLMTNSIALLSDSGHMLSDASSLLLSFIAVSFAAKPPSSNKTYGYYRFEILAAFINGITLFVVAGFIMIEAIGRFVDPPKVASQTMMIIAAIGLLANLLSAWSLMRKGNVEGNINVKSAYLHIVGDALGSVGAIVASLLMLLFEWYVADPIISVAVALLILKSAWGVLQQSTHILMEGTPAGMNQADIQKSLRAIAGVVDVHDLHLWSITSDMDSFSCHIVIEDSADSQAVLQAAIVMMAEQYHIGHTTIQVETSRIHHESLHQIKG